jgi:hypothetical protein
MRTTSDQRRDELALFFQFSLTAESTEKSAVVSGFELRASDFRPEAGILALFFRNISLKCRGFFCEAVGCFRFERIVLMLVLLLI